MTPRTHPSHTTDVTGPFACEGCDDSECVHRGGHVLNVLSPEEAVTEYSCSSDVAGGTGPIT